MNIETDPFDDLPIPPRLAEDLRRLAGPRLSVPASVDEAILGRARLHFARRRRLRLMLRWTLPAAAAAVVALAVWLQKPAGDGSSLTADGKGAALAREDIDANGRVDILDAFALARRIEAADHGMAASADINGDGVIDSADVQAIAAAAVRLDRGTLQ